MEEKPEKDEGERKTAKQRNEENEEGVKEMFCSVNEKDKSGKMKPGENKD